MRRFSTLMVAALATTSFITATAQGVSAAGGELKVTTVSTLAPTSVPNAQIMKMARLTKTSSFLVVGIDQTTSGANARVWKLKDDLTVDTSFAAVDLGDDTEKPTSSNSDCVAQSRTNCYRVDGFAVNETAGKYAIAISREITVTVNQSPRSNSLYTIVTGDIATGAVTGRRTFISKSSAFDPTTDFAAYNPSTLMSDTCNTEVGSTYQGVSLGMGTPRGYNMTVRPDGSVLIYLNCFYYTSSQSSLTEYNVYGIVALKASSSSLAVDASWGTNGFLKVFDDAAKCGDVFSNSTDSSIAANSSTKMFTIVSVQTYNRVTTYPFGGNITTYNGCASMGSPAYSAIKLLTVKANGAVLSTIPTSLTQSVGRWVIDADGRWNSTVSSGSGSGMTTSLLRITAAGALDTSLASTGMKVIPNMPATITVNGTSVTMRYNFTGIAISSKGVLFSGFSSASTSNNFNCSIPTNYQTTYFPYYLTLEDGLVTDYGTNGVGEGFVLQQSSADVCSGSNASVSFVNGKGQPTQINTARAIGSQTAGLKMAVWNAAAGVTTGGDGTGLVGSGSSAGRVDKKVYSTKLPSISDANSALQVLTTKQASDFDIRSNTPKVCIALTTSVLMVNPGRCTVRIIDEDTKQVIRRMTTVVKNTDVDTGTTLTTDEPIYFKQAGIRLSKTALAQVKELATAAKDAARVVIIGHSAALGEVSEYSYAISRNRAEAVRAALVKAGVKTTIEIVAMAYTQPEKTAKTEAAQAKNRRAEVYIFPK